MLRRPHVTPSQLLLSRHFCLLLAATSSVPMIPAVVAQDDFALEEIVVTARKVEENLQDVPISITAYGQQDILNLGFLSLEDLDSNVPNFKLDQGQGYTGDTSIAIRGVSSRDTSSGFESTFAVILDDVYIGRSVGYNSTLLDIERIEVLRGPQGTLQGRNVVGGAINMVTTKPGDEFSARGRVGYGRFDTYYVDAVISGPLKEGVLAGKLSLTQRDSDGWGYNVDLDQDQGGTESTGGRLQLLATPTDRLEMLFTADYTSDDVNDIGLDSDPDPTLTSPSSSMLDRRFGGDFANETTRDTYGAALNVYYDFQNGMQLASISSYRGFELETDVDQDNSASISNAGFAVHSSSDQEQTQFSQEFRLHSASDSDIGWVAGVYYYTEELENLSYGSAGPYIPGLGVIGGFNQSDSTVETDHWAVFGSAFIDLTDAWNLTIGLRYNDTDRDISVSDTVLFDFFAPLAPPPVAPFPIATITEQEPLPTDFDMALPLGTNEQTVSDEEWTGDVSLRYSFSDEVSMYAKYARGHKSGGFNTQFSFGQGGGVVDPEFIDTYEIGYRSFLLNRKLRLNATVFYLDYTDQQVTQFEATPAGIVFTTDNIGQTESYGAEIEAHAALSDRLFLTLGLGLLDSEFKEGDNEGNVPFNSPDMTFSSLVQYTRPVSSSLELFLMGAANWTDDYFTDATNAPLSFQEDHWMVNARVGLQSDDGRWSVRLFGENLLDEDIQTTALNAGILSLYGLTAPRTYGVELLVNLN